MTMDDGFNFYEVLGVPENATTDEIKAAYFALVRRYRPTEHPIEFQRFSIASRTLTDTRRRNEYDQTRRAGRRVQVLVDQAAAAADKDPQKAMTLLKSAIAIAPDTPRPRLLLAHVMMRIEEYALAEKQYRWLIREVPGDETLHFKMARCLWLQDRNGEAEAELVQAVKINPLYHDAHMLLSRMYEKAGKHALAVFSLEKAIENDGVEDYADVDALLRLFVLYIHLSDSDEARRTRQRILDVTPADERIATRTARRLYHRARDLHDDGEHSVAISVLGIALELKPVEEDLAGDIRGLARTVLLANEASQMIGDELLPESVRLMARVIYLEKGAEALRRLRYEEMKNALTQDNFADARRMLQSVTYVRRQYKSVAKDAEGLLDHIQKMAQNRIEALGGNVTRAMPIGDGGGNAPTGSMPTAAREETADKRDDRGGAAEPGGGGGGAQGPRGGGLLGWLRGGKDRA